MAMRVYLGPTDAKHFHVSFYELTVEQLNWLAAFLRTARDAEKFGSDPNAKELLDRLDDAIRSQPKTVRDSIRRQLSGPQKDKARR
jgi:hypothetical protein